MGWRETHAGNMESRSHTAKRDSSFLRPLFSGSRPANRARSDAALDRCGWLWQSKYQRQDRRILARRRFAHLRKAASSVAGSSVQKRFAVFTADDGYREKNSDQR